MVRLLRSECEMWEKLVVCKMSPSLASKTWLGVAGAFSVRDSANLIAFGAIPARGACEVGFFFAALCRIHFPTYGLYQFDTRPRPLTEESSQSGADHGLNAE